MLVNNEDRFWFSHKVNKYNIVKKNGSKKIEFTDDKVVMDWDNCSLDVVGKIDDGRTRIVLRSETNRNSHYMGDKPIELRFMLGIDVSRISEIYHEPYHVDSMRKNLPQTAKSKNSRTVFRLDDEYWIWEWMDDEGDSNQDKERQYEQRNHTQFLSKLEKIHKQISDQMSSNLPKIPSDLFNVYYEDNKANQEILRNNNVIPVIYQPSIDSLENFVREVHCSYIGQNMVQVSLLFENEQLRRHRHVNKIYELFRLLFYGRKIDIESFNIKTEMTKFNDNRKLFTFENIYSNDHNILEDTIHGNPTPPEIKVKYFFSKYSFPIVFINTSNHAMAEHDSNHDLWKWEYIPFMKESPVIFGRMSRREIDHKFTPFFRKLFDRRYKK